LISQRVTQLGGIKQQSNGKTGLHTRTAALTLALARLSCFIFHVYNMQGTFRLRQMLPVHAIKLRLSKTFVV